MGSQRAPHKQGLPEEKDIAIKLLKTAAAAYSARMVLFARLLC